MPYLLLGLSVLLIVNVVATQRVNRYTDDYGGRKLLLTMTIWLFPFVGAFSAFVHVQPPRKQAVPEIASPPVAVVAIPETIAGPQGKDFPVMAHMFAANGVPMMDWKALADWANDCFDAEGAKAAIEQGRRIWLMHLREALTAHAYLHETPGAFVLSSLEPVVARTFAEYIGSTRQRILMVLKGMAELPEGEKSILVVLDSEEDYYHYVANFYPDEGEFAFSGGMFIDAGCPHFVCVRADTAAMEAVIAHEMTHLAMSRLRLPRWLDEGIAVNTERRIAGARGQLYTPRELHAKHLGFWNGELIQQFWSGEAFQRTDDGNLLSYELARIMVEQFAKQWDAFVAFVLEAEREDGGLAAARKAFGVDLGEVASVLLEGMGDESWTPNSASWVAV